MRGPPRGLHGEAGLPDASYPGEREQPHILLLREQAPHLFEFALAATSGVAGVGSADAGEDSSAADEAASTRSGTEARSTARPSSESPSASAKDLTVWGCGRLLVPRSSAPMALGERPARKANPPLRKPCGLPEAPQAGA